ncbi:MAG TPA: 2-amino-4-hydroxy-6-hydroxymethyldihydropteridine diphosphokinase [Candidatus Acidoferrum sp.]|nr:2-amino-4-hydroxy-6-hydroxymethyldihydropteridine diphosphokinase [Candidatus Acidoferrum sp.]
MAETTVYLSLGSNIGDRENNLRKAIRALTEANVRVTRVSSLYETEPVDLREQPWFLNCVVRGETETPALDLLRALRGIEAHMGSEKLVPKGPRLIDIDILLYGDATVDRPELQVPHPRMLQRKFVLVPLAEIAPNLKHPSWAGTAKHIVSNLADASAVHKFEASI